MFSKTIAMPVSDRISELKEILSALDEALSDSDITHVESDDEMRSEYPAQWAATRLAKMIQEIDCEK